MYWPQLFLFGTLLSSVGSQIFFISLLGSLGEIGFHTTLVSVLVGAIRFAPFFTLAFLNRYVDRWSPRTVVIATELLAGLCSLCIYFLWPFAGQHFGVFSAVCVVRAAVVAAQTGSRNRILKQMNHSSSTSEDRMTIWLNKATHGGILISALVSIYFASIKSFQSAIIFDFISFLVGGLFTLFAPKSIPENGKPTSLVKALRSFYKIPGGVAFSDLLVAIVMAGLNMYMFRLGGGRFDTISLLFVIYGASIWISGYSLRIRFVSNSKIFWWFLLGVGYFSISLELDLPFRFLAFFIVTLSYWILYHQFSAAIQRATSANEIGSVTIVRTLQMLAILFIGEWLVGMGSLYFSYAAESVIRGCLALVFGFVLWRRQSI